MLAPRRIAGPVLLAAMVPLAVGLAQSQRTSGPLDEDQVARMVALKVKGEVIASMVQKQGLAFTADDAALERLKKAGAPDAVLDAVRQAAAPKPAAPADSPVTYQDVVELLNLGVPEAGILERLKQSPTAFTLDQKQVEELKRLGATPALLEAMKSVRTEVDAASEISNLALVVDCSGSMSERTPEGRTKMEAARQAAIKLVQEVREGVRLAFVIYGHNRAQECDAVQVVRPLEPLDAKGRAELVRRIGGLQPVGSTPIALALRTAGQELAKATAPSGLVLISDGKEMCNGNPASEAAALTRRLKLGFGVQVVGFGVKPDEKQALEEIAAAGRGKYYDAPTPAALRDVVQMLGRRFREEAKPIALSIETPPQDLDPAVQALVDQLSDKELAARREAALGLKGLGDKAAAPALMKRVADDVWTYFNQFTGDHSVETSSKLAALDALKALAPEKVVPALAAATRSKEPRVRAWAADQLGKAAGPPAEDAAPDERPTTSSPELAVQVLVERLTDKDLAVRRAAALSLKQIGDKAAAPALMKRVADDVWTYFNQFTGDHSVETSSKLAALDALKALAPERVKTALVSAMKSRNPEVRTWAARQMGQLADTKAKD
jgi:Mg-chelatase subunit ChlD